MATDSVDLRQMWWLMAEVYAVCRQNKKGKIFIIALIIWLQQNFLIQSQSYSDRNNWDCSLRLRPYNFH